MGEMSQERLKIVKNAFQILDTEKTGSLDFEYIKNQYMPHNHPDVLLGKKGDEEVFEEFLNTFETHR
jgi:Ca2+-binding EF-hand superfamily protein